MTESLIILLWLYGIQQPCRVLMAEDANFILVLLFFFSFSKLKTGKRSVSVDILRMDGEKIFSPFELQTFL